MSGWRGLGFAIALAACAEGRAEIASSSPSATAATAASATTTTPAPSESSPSPPASAPAPVALPPGHWCTEGLAALDEATCYFLPDAPAAPRALLVYLHGVIAPTGRTQRIVQQIVLARARARGFAALMPRGRRGIAPKNVKDWWAWPTSADAHARYAKELVASWMDQKRRLERIAGAPFERTYLAGSSNGAYFVSILALKGEIAADGFGAMSGGNAAGRTTTTLAATRPPFYVGWGANDDTNGDPKSLAALLARAGWPSKSAEHPVGHGAREAYLDEAFDFWSAR